MKTVCRLSVRAYQPAENASLISGRWVSQRQCCPETLDDPFEEQMSHIASTGLYSALSFLDR
jgi:hypothetical protein